MYFGQNRYTYLEAYILDKKAVVNFNIIGSLIFWGDHLKSQSAQSQLGIVLDQVPIQSLSQVPSGHLSKWLKGTWSSNFSDFFSEGHPAECLPDGGTTIFPKNLNTQDMANFAANGT